MSKLRQQDLYGHNVAITGTFVSFTRAQLRRQLEHVGARVSSTITGSTTMLLVGDRPGDVKLGQAAKRLIPTFEEDDFAGALSSAMVEEKPELAEPTPIPDHYGTF
jgi:NAD-dependent DNA ligase